MANKWANTDLYDWKQAFSNTTSNSSTNADPPELTHFAGGQRKAGLLVDYQLSLTDTNNAVYTATLEVYLYNRTTNTYQYWKSIALSTGNNRIKIDTHGSPGGFKLANMSNATLDWLVFDHVNRETGGN